MSMSDKATHVEASVSTAEADKHHLTQARYWAGRLDFAMPILDIAHNERLELRHQVTPSGIGATVFRHRHTNRRTSTREDVYFGLKDAGEGAALVVLADDLNLETQWVDAGEFEKIGPRHDALFSEVAEGTHPDAHAGDHEDYRELLRLVHEAVSIQQHAEAS